MSLCAKYAWFLLALLLVSNGFWLYQMSIASVAAAYTQDRNCSLERSALDASTLLPIAARAQGRRQDLLSAVETMLGKPLPESNEHKITIGGVSLDFDDQGLLASAKPIGFVSFANCGQAPLPRASK